MSLPAPITISQEAKLILDAVAEYVVPLGGVAEIVSSEKMFYRADALDSQTPRVMICYGGETARGSFSQKSPWHRVDRTWKVAVTRGRGFFAERGASLYDSEQQEIPLYDVLENVRDVVRFMQNISEETPMPDYNGTTPMSFGNMVVDGFVVNIQTANDIPSNLTTE